jgi:hypothetical protein
LSSSIPAGATLNLPSNASGDGGGFGVEAEAERPNDLQDGGELRVAIAAQCLVERLRGQAGFLGELRRAASARDHAWRIGDLAGVAIHEGAVEISEDRFSGGVLLSADQMRQTIQEYGQTLITPPNEAFSNVDAIRVTNVYNPTWSVRLDLWTKEERRSDLSVECTIVDLGEDELDLEVDNIHVLWLKQSVWTSRWS